MTSAEGADAPVSALQPTSAHVHPGPGLRARRSGTVAYLDSLSEWSNLPTPIIADCLNRMYSLTGIRRLNGSNRVLGPACTVKLFPGDNLFVHVALEMCSPGDMLVVDARGGPTAVVGASVSTKALRKKIAGIVVDGFIRDLPEIRDVGIPVFAKGHEVSGPLHRGPGEVNFPVSCCGVAVCPGDLIVADERGVVAVPQADVSAIMSRAVAASREDAAYSGLVQAGAPSTAWIDDALSRLGVDRTTLQLD